MPISDYNKIPGILTCRESARLLSDDLDRTLSRPERLALHIHLVLCHQCRKFGRNLARLRHLLCRMSEERLSDERSAPTLTPEERARIRKTVASAKS